MRRTIVGHKAQGFRLARLLRRRRGMIAVERWGVHPSLATKRVPPWAEIPQIAVHAQTSGLGGAAAASRSIVHRAARGRREARWGREGRREGIRSPRQDGAASVRSVLERASGRRGRRARAAGGGGGWRTGSGTGTAASAFATLVRSLDLRRQRALAGAGSDESAGQSRSGNRGPRQTEAGGGSGRQRRRGHSRGSWTKPLSRARPREGGAAAVLCCRRSCTPERPRRGIVPSAVRAVESDRRPRRMRRP